MANGDDMSFFINLPLRHIADTPHYVDYALEHGLWPEVGIDAWSMQELALDWHYDLAGRLHKAGLSCSVHLPFFDLSPGSLDNGICAASRDRLLAAVELAKIYRPRLMIGHASFDPWQHAEHMDEWLDRSVRTWQALLAAWPDGPPLYLENIHEKDPAPIVRLLNLLPVDRTGFCFDLGHWYSYAGGRESDNLAWWLEAIGPCLRHLHLHDNDGSDDQHKGLGQGDIPIGILLSVLTEKGLRPTFTLEPHDFDAFRQSLDYMAKHAAAFKRLFLAS